MRKEKNTTTKPAKPLSEQDKNLEWRVHSQKQFDALNRRIDEKMAALEKDVSFIKADTRALRDYTHLKFGWMGESIKHLTVASKLPTSEEVRPAAGPSKLTVEGMLNNFEQLSDAQKKVFIKIVVRRSKIFDL
jgi:hypothetical protein